MQTNEIFMRFLADLVETEHMVVCALGGVERMGINSLSKLCLQLLRLKILWQIWSCAVVKKTTIIVSWQLIGFFARIA